MLDVFVADAVNALLRADHAEAIQAAVREELSSQQAEAQRGLHRAAKRKQQADAERQKLLLAHYAGAVPQELLAIEMQRLTRELKEADLEIEAAKATNRDVEVMLAAALAAATNCRAAYAPAPNHIRRQLKQGFFEKLYVGEDSSVERAEATEPFRALLEVRDALPGKAPAVPAGDTEACRVDGEGEVVSRLLPSSVLQAAAGGEDALVQSDHPNTRSARARMFAGVNVFYVVGMTGFEAATLRSDAGGSQVFSR